MCLLGTPGPTFRPLPPGEPQRGGRRLMTRQSPRGTQLMPATGAKSNSFVAVSRVKGSRHIPACALGARGNCQVLYACSALCRVPRRETRHECATVVANKLIRRNIEPILSTAGASRPCAARIARRECERRRGWSAVCVLLIGFALASVGTRSCRSVVAAIASMPSGLRADPHSSHATA